MAVLVDQPRHEARQHVGRIGHRTAEESRVQVLVWSRNLDLHVGQAAQAARDRGGLHRDHRGVGHQDDVGLEHPLVLAAEVVEARRTDLLLAFEHELHVAGQAVGRAHRLESLDVHEKLPLVIVGTAAPDASLFHHRFERIGQPLADRLHGHHVVVAVDQHGLGRWVDDLLAVHHRISCGGHHFGPIRTGLDQRGGQMLRTAHHILPVRRLRTHRRDSQHLEQLVEEPILILLYIKLRFFHSHLVFFST